MPSLIRVVACRQPKRPTMRWLLWSLLLLLLLECTTARRMADASAYDEQEFDGDYDEDDELPFAPEFNKFAEKVQRAVDSQGLLRARRWGNIANGILLGATGPVTLGVSLFGLKLSGVVLSVYMTAAGALLTGLELGVSPIVSWTKQNLNWLTTHSGKTALLFFAGNLGWCVARPTAVAGAWERVVRRGWAAVRDWERRDRPRASSAGDRSAACARARATLNAQGIREGRAGAGAADVCERPLQSEVSERAGLCVGGRAAWL